MAPFLPLVSLLNHNLDQDRWDTATRVVPMYVALIFLLLSLLVWRARGAASPWGSAEIFVLLYIGFSAAQIPGSLDPAWAHILNQAFGETKIPALPTTWLLPE